MILLLIISTKYHAPVGAWCESKCITHLQGALVIHWWLLWEGGSSLEIWCIRFHSVGPGVIREHKDWGRSDQSLNLPQGLLLHLPPFPWLLFFREVKEWSSMQWEVLDEVAIEVCKSKEGLHFPPISQSWPLHDSLDLDWVHLHLSFWDDESKVFHPSLFWNLWNYWC